MTRPSVTHCAGTICAVVGRAGTNCLKTNHTETNCE